MGKEKNLEVVETSRFFVGGDKRDRTADLLNAIERRTTFYGAKVREIVNLKSF